MGYQFRRRTIEITFDPTDLVFSCRPEGSDTTSCLPVQRLTKAYLRGELTAFLKLPPYQLALPFTIDDWRSLEYIRVLTTP